MQPVLTSHDDRFQMLKNSGWAPFLTDSECDILTRFLLAFDIKDSAVLFEEGAKGDSLGIIVKGQLAVMKNDNEGIPHRIAALPVGSAFGEMALIDGGPRSASVCADPEATILCLTEDNFNSLFQEYPTVASRILFSIAQSMSARLRETNEKLLEALNSRPLQP